MTSSMTSKLCQILGTFKYEICRWRWGHFVFSTKQCYKETFYIFSTNGFLGSIVDFPFSRNNFRSANEGNDITTCMKLSSHRRNNNFKEKITKYSYSQKSRRVSLIATRPLGDSGRVWIIKFINRQMVS